MKLGNKQKYKSYNPIETRILCDAMSSIPGIKIIQSNLNQVSPMSIWFYALDQQGLFFLTRCVDKRYFQHSWEITLSVGDECLPEQPPHHLPIVYLLESKSIGLTAINESVALIDNLNRHLNHKNFIKAYQIDTTKFITEDKYRDLLINDIIKNPLD
jgi:hypothetical protein